MKQVPPNLARAAIKSIEQNKWQEHLPLLEKLKETLGAPSKDELELIELDRRIRTAYEAKSPQTWRETYLAKREMNLMMADRIALTEKLTGSLGYELREDLDKAIGAF